MLRRLLSLLIAMTLAPTTFGEEVAMLSATESVEQRDQRMEWWRGARFGMFIHWGLYAIPAGEWNGEPVKGIGEWIMHRAKIPLEEYRPLKDQFEPQNYDPALWAQIAADAGMKYLVITAKHHDGFCLFDTGTTEWDVVDGTPHKKDLLKSLADECRKRGVRFCTYYSILDWAHPAQRVKPVDKHAYVTDMKLQLKELIDGCDPDVLWFDGEWVPWWTEADGRDLYAYLLDLKPTLIVNNRVGKGRKGMAGFNRDDQEYSGDFGTPEQEIPATGVPGVDWESCMTMNDTWGFKRRDHNWKSDKELIHNLIDIVSKGGNFLLNVGPTDRGEIPTPSVERLASMGEWMHRYGDSLYGSHASPVGQPAWGRCTTKQQDDGHALYFHVFEWPEDGVLTVKGVENAPRKCQLVGDYKTLDATYADGTLSITVPKKAPHPIASVIRADFAND